MCIHNAFDFHNLKTEQKLQEYNLRYDSLNDPWYFNKISLQSRKCDDVSKSLITSPEKKLCKIVP